MLVMEECMCVAWWEGLQQQQQIAPMPCDDAC